MKKNSTSGFTLIELLVVIAIIGILASVVLASLNSARTKGADAAIKANLANARAQAELYYDTGSTYLSVCSTASTGIPAMTAAAASAAGTAAPINTLATAQISTTTNCHDTAAGWAASAPLKSGGYYCVDSTGFSGNRVSVLAISSITCPTT